MSQHESGAKGSGGRDEEARGDEREAEGRCSRLCGYVSRGVLVKRGVGLGGWGGSNAISVSPRFS